MARLPQHQPGQDTKTDVGPPPSYRIQDLESSWDRTCPEDWKDRPWNVAMTFHSHPNAKSCRGMDWEAQLAIVAKNIPRLMREGFHWSVANVRKEEGYFLIGKKQVDEEAIAPVAWTNGRVYSIADLAEPPQWIGRIMVFANKAPVLSEFKLESITIDKTDSAMAKNRDGRYIYSYSASAERPGWKCNAIYDDMPLGGWWPWPKEKRMPDDKHAQVKD